MISKLKYALFLVLVFLGLSVLAFFYKPPEVAYNQMVYSLEKENIINAKLKGLINGEKIEADLIKNTDGEVFVRISYNPLKLINNQWVKFDAGLIEDIFKAFHPVARINFEKDEEVLVDRYKFALKDGPVFEQIPELNNGQGDMLFSLKTRLPEKIYLNISNGSVFEINMDYINDISKEITNYREMGDVVEQLNSAGVNNKVIASHIEPLSLGSGDSKPFYSDFDRDGLSDALEVFYGTDPSNPDTDSDTFSDGEEITKGYNPVGEGALY